MVYTFLSIVSNESVRYSSFESAITRELGNKLGEETCWLVSMVFIKVWVKLKKTFYSTSSIHTITVASER